MASVIERRDCLRLHAIAKNVENNLMQKGPTGKYEPEIELKFPSTINDAVFSIKTILERKSEFIYNESERYHCHLISRESKNKNKIKLKVTMSDRRDQKFEKIANDLHDLCETMDAEDICLRLENFVHRDIFPYTNSKLKHFRRKLAQLKFIKQEDYVKKGDNCWSRRRVDLISKLRKMHSILGKELFDVHMPWLKDLCYDLRSYRPFYYFCNHLQNASHDGGEELVNRMMIYFQPQCIEPSTF